MHHNIFILTGAKQTGKTTSLQNALQNSNTNWAGVLMPIINEQRHLLNITTKQLFNLATESPNSLRVGKYVFNPEPFISITNTLVENLSHTPNIIIDEIGPLELEQQYGFYKLLQTVLQFKTTLKIIIVARPKVLNELVAVCKPYANTLTTIQISQVSEIV
jgi:nucleoside-triphosphatase THEP1